MDETKDYQWSLVVYLFYPLALMFCSIFCFLAFKFPRKLQLLACAMFVDDVINKVLLYIKQFEFPKKELGTSMNDVYRRCYVLSSLLSMDDIMYKAPYCLWTMLCTKFSIVYKTI